MTTLLVAEDDDPANPLDLIEEFCALQDWPHQRAGEDEILAEVVGHWGTYRLFFLWHGDPGALQFCCRLDMRVPDQRRAAMHELLAKINERLWLGHFDIAADDQGPVFRHTILLRGTAGASPEIIEDLVEIAILECERFFPAFQTVIWAGKNADEAMTAAILDPIGEA